MHKEHLREQLPHSLSGPKHSTISQALVLLGIKEKSTDRPCLGCSLILWLSSLFPSLCSHSPQASVRHSSNPSKLYGITLGQSWMWSQTAVLSDLRPRATVTFVRRQKRGCDCFDPNNKASLLTTLSFCTLGCMRHMKLFQVPLTLSQFYVCSWVEHSLPICVSTDVILPRRWELHSSWRKMWEFLINPNQIGILAIQYY